MRFSAIIPGLRSLSACHAGSEQIDVGCLEQGVHLFLMSWKLSCCTGASGQVHMVAFPFFFYFLGLCWVSDEAHRLLLLRQGGLADSEHKS